MGIGGAWSARPAPRVSGPKRRAAGPSASTILPGAPERVTVAHPDAAPWHGTALLNLFSGQALVRVGTGFLCEPDVLLTARHNLLPVNYDSAGVWLGFDARLNPGVAPVAVRSYATHKSLDLAVLILAGSSPGTFDLGRSPPGKVTLGGYALPYPDQGARLSYAEGDVTDATTDRLSYLISTREGDSGAPVFVTSQGTPSAVAVHTSGAAPGAPGNSGQRLTEAVIADIRLMIAWAREQTGAST